MTEDRTFLRNEIKRMKSKLAKEVSEFVASKDTTRDGGEALILLIDSILFFQRKLNATYKPMDERTIIERANKRVAKKASRERP